MAVVFTYAALLAVLFVSLSIRAIGMRRRLKIPIGDGGDTRMIRAMRVQANFAEYVPFALLLLYFVEASGAAPLLVHALCITLLGGRILHAYGVSQPDEKFALRVSGMTLTFMTLLVSAGVLLLAAVRG